MSRCRRRSSRCCRTARDVTGAGVLIITHDLGVVAEFADRALVMYAGRAVETADVDVLYRDRRMPYTAGLLGSVPRLDAPQGARLVPIPGAPPSMAALPPGCPFAPRCPLAVDAAAPPNPSCSRSPQRIGRRASAPKTLQAGALRTSTAYPPSRPPSRRPPTSRWCCRCAIWCKTYKLTKGVVFRRQVGEVRAVDGVSFELQQGRTLGIVGESGSGKSTTLHQILELSAPQSGSIEVLGSDVATLDRHTRRALRGDLQVVFQDPVASLDPRLPVSDVLAEPLQANGFDKRRTDERVAELLGIVGLAPRGRQPLPCRVLRRAEAAHRHSAGTGLAAEDPRSR